MLVQWNTQIKNKTKPGNIRMTVQLMRLLKQYLTLIVKLPLKIENKFKVCHQSKVGEINLNLRIRRSISKNLFWMILQLKNIWKEARHQKETLRQAGNQLIKHH